MVKFNFFYRVGKILLKFMIARIWQVISKKLGCWKNYLQFLIASLSEKLNAKVMW